MSETERHRLRLVREWISVAEADLEACNVLRQSLSRRRLGYLIAFHAQQAVEKYLKAWLVLKNAEFPFTHDIVKLLDLCRKHGGRKWARGLGEAETLTAYAIKTRYPFAQAELTAKEVASAIRLARRVRTAALSALHRSVAQAYGDSDDADIRAELRSISQMATAQRVSRGRPSP